MKNLKNQARKGVTMIEIVVVIAVLAILALFIVPRISGISSSASTTQSNSDKKVVNDMLEAFEASGGVLNAAANVSGSNHLDTSTVASILTGLQQALGVVAGGNTFKLASAPGNTGTWTVNGAGAVGARIN